jgi:hypothetical protein
MRPITSATLSILTSILAFGCGGGGGNDDNASSCGNFRVINGGECTRADIPTVLIKINTASGQLSCTGTVIGEDWVVTAAHCLTPDTTGVELIHDNGVATGEEGYTHPGYDGSSTNDVAVIKASGIRSNFGINKATIGLADRVQAGDFLTFVGYGVDNDGNFGQSLPNQNPRVTDIRVIGLDFGVIVTRFEETNSNPCFGDSGGGAFLDGRLVGVESSGRDERECREGGQNFLTDLQNGGNLGFIETLVPDLSIN